MRRLRVRIWRGLRARLREGEGLTLAGARRGGAFDAFASRGQSGWGCHGGAGYDSRAPGGKLHQYKLSFLSKGTEPFSVYGSDGAEDEWGEGRVRLDGKYRSPGRPLLGRADRAFAAPLQHRLRRDAARVDTRAAAFEEGCRARQRESGQALAGQGAAHRAGGGRGYRGEVGRAFPSARLADRFGNADEHERQRGHLE